MRAAAIALLALFAVASAQAGSLLLAPQPLGASSTQAAPELRAHISKSSDGNDVALTLSPCSGDEIAECIYHELSCRKSDWGVQFTVIVGDVLAIAEQITRQLAVAPDARGKTNFRLSGGRVQVQVDTASYHLDSNEMDGGWMLSITLDDAFLLFQTMTAENTRNATVELGGVIFSLAPMPDDGAKLLEFKDACKVIKGY